MGIPKVSQLGVMGIAVVSVLGGGWIACRATPQTIPPLPASRVLLTKTLDGVIHKLADDGKIYRVDPATGRWVFESVLFDPAIVARSYIVRNGRTYRVDLNTGREFPVRRTFTEGFERLPENEAGLRGLLTETHGWSEATLQSPETPTVAQYVALRHEILAGRRDFADARVAPTLGDAHEGRAALRCVCPPRTNAMICAKASLTTGLVRFVDGDVVRYEAWYRLPGPAFPFTLVDLESDLMNESPGLRVMIFDGRELGIEMKALEKPTFRQPTDRAIPVPRDRWFRLRWEIGLAAGERGWTRLWQDDRLIVDAHGPTLPFASAIYNSLEVGCTAHTFGNRPAVVLMDDLRIEALPTPKHSNSSGAVRRPRPGKRR